MSNKKNKILFSTLLFIIITLIIVIITFLSIGINKYIKELYKVGIPTTDKKINNIILMIGDGMGENHVKAGAIYKGEELNIQKIKKRTYVTTFSTEEITDSAAAATAMATGYKANNGVLGKDKYGNKVENLTEYAKKQGMKTGIVCTQILNHATPAGFSIHTSDRYNYDKIVQYQIETDIDLMLGGGREYFSKYQNEMLQENWVWINDLSKLEEIDKNAKVIGTFGEESISKENSRTSLKDMTSAAIDRLENENGFFLMIEGSDIDTYSHQNNMQRMLNEMVDFDNAVKVAMDYVDNNKDTLLIVTADHETGGLKLEGVTDANQLTDSLFTTGEHTAANVLLYAYGLGEKDLTKYRLIDNTFIYKFIKQSIDNMYK